MCFANLNFSRTRHLAQVNASATVKKRQSLLPEDGVTLRNVVNNKIVLFLSICGRC